MLSVHLLFISALLLSPSVLGLKKRKSGKKHKKGKGDQCIPALRKTARATAIKEEIGGDYLACGTEAIYRLNINGTFYDYPFFNSTGYEGNFSIVPIDTSPQRNLALFDMVFGPANGPAYNNEGQPNRYIGKWNFVTERLVGVPSDDIGDNHGVAKKFVCEKYEDDGYPPGTLACEGDMVTIEVEDMPTSEYKSINVGPHPSFASHQII